MENTGAFIFDGAAVCHFKLTDPYEKPALYCSKEFMNTEDELRELDVFCAENVMGWVGRIRQPDTTYPELRYWNKGDGYEILQAQFRPSTDPAAAMQVLQKCAEKLPVGINICRDGKNWFIDRPDDDSTAAVFAETLLLAICEFAKKLYSK